jgi:phytoene dehydrogenase-like protein
MSKSGVSASNDSRFDAIVIGAGFGGSACAAVLAKEGLKVALVDKNSRPGGKAMTVAKDGFRYELWPVIHAPAEGSVCETVLDLVGAREKVEVLKPGRQGSTYIDKNGGFCRMPQDPTPDPIKIFEILGVPEHQWPAAMEVLGALTLMSAEEAATLDAVSFADWLARYDVPQPIMSFLCGIANGVFMVPIDRLAASEGVSTIQQMFLRGGGLYCKGGIGRFAEAYCESVEDHGGRVMLRTSVERICVREGRVTGVETSAGTLSAPIVISNAGLQPTVLKLVGGDHFETPYLDYVKSLEPSWGMMGTRYFLDRPLLDEPYYMIFSDGGYWDSARWENTKDGTVPRDVVLWIEIPANFDAAMAPADRQLVLTGVWCESDPDSALEHKQIWWNKIDEMMERLWPGFRSHVERVEHYDTHDVSMLTRAATQPGTGGECIGLGQVIGQCGTSKPAAESPLPGLFFVGCDAGGFGCGTHQAVQSGLDVARLVLKRRSEGMR